MEHSHLFDRVLASLGFKRQIDLSVALGRKPGAAWNWRKFGFPKRVLAELQVLSSKLDKPLPQDFYTYTGIPSPHCPNTHGINNPNDPQSPQNSTRERSGE